MGFRVPLPQPVLLSGSLSRWPSPDALLTGEANETTVQPLSSQTKYSYRLRPRNQVVWSPTISVTTTRKELSGEDLHRAVANGDVLAVKTALDAGVGADVPNRFGSSPLMSAAFQGDAGVVEALLKAGADVSFGNHSGKTSAMLASFGGHLGVLQQLSAAGASMTVRDHGGERRPSLGLPCGSRCVPHPTPLRPLTHADAGTAPMCIFSPTQAVTVCTGHVMARTRTLPRFSLRPAAVLTRPTWEAAGRRCCAQQPSRVTKRLHECCWRTAQTRMPSIVTARPH